MPEVPGVARASLPLRLASPVFLLRAGSRLGAGTGAGAEALELISRLKPRLAITLKSGGR